MMIVAPPPPGSLGSYTPVWVALVGFVLAFIAATAIGRKADGPMVAGVFRRGSEAIERFTTLPGWVVATVGTALLGVFLGGSGFYNDIAWHLTLGRDRRILVAPHTAILVGLAFIPLAAALGTVQASLGQRDVGFRWRGLRVPYTCLCLAALGAVALSGFALDQWWHGTYGIDVAMWSPPHLISIVGASLTPLAAWLVLAEAGVAPTDGWRARLAHFVCAVLALGGLSAVQAEYAYGIPQFQLLYLPVLVAIAGGFVLVAVRLVIGKGAALWVAAINAAVGFGGFLTSREFGPLHVRPAGTYLVAAAVVEAVAILLGTERRVRFSVVAGIGVGTIGFAGDWIWSNHLPQPWSTHLLPGALLLSMLAALGAAAIGAAFAQAFSTVDRRLSRKLLLGAAALLLICLSVPFPRRVGNVVGHLHVETAGNRLGVSVQLEPPDAAARARWFQLLAFQGGNMVVANMKSQGHGLYVADRKIALPLARKTMLRLHRGNQLMALPVTFPADPAIGKRAIPLRDRTSHFERETKFLLREQHGGAAFVAFIVVTFGLLAVVLWIALLAVTVSRFAGKPSIRSKTVL